MSKALGVKLLVLIDWEVPDLCWEETSSFLIVSDHWKYQTKGANRALPGNQTLPAPHLKASTRPLYWGGFMV